MVLEYLFILMGIKMYKVSHKTKHDKSILYLTIFEGIWNLCQADKPGIASFRVLEDLFNLVSMKNHKVWHATRHD